MFDTISKFLTETFPEDYATWLLGRPVPLTQLSPTELSLEPIRADSLILEQSEDLVLHLEFQTKPDENMGFRMLDYATRVYRRLVESRLGISPSPSQLEPCVRFSPHTAPDILGG
jgi:predicted transposase/invertase (TIGR01784 family)